MLKTYPKRAQGENCWHPIRHSTYELTTGFINQRALQALLFYYLEVSSVICLLLLLLLPAACHRKVTHFDMPAIERLPFRPPAGHSRVLKLTLWTYKQKNSGRRQRVASVGWKCSLWIRSHCLYVWNPLTCLFEITKRVCFSTPNIHTCVRESSGYALSRSHLLSHVRGQALNLSWGLVSV